MTIEQIMNPRFLVCAHYPDSLFKIGDILKRIPNATNDWFAKDGIEFTETGVNESIPLSEIKKCGAIFRPLHWSEYRDDCEMPTFIKDKSDPPSVYRNYGFDRENFDGVVYLTKHANPISIAYFLPATEQEYNTFMLHKKNTKIK